MTWPGERVEPVPAGAGRADPYTERDAQHLRVLLAVEARFERRLGDPRREWRLEEWRLGRIVRTAFMPGDGSAGGDLL